MCWLDSRELERCDDDRQQVRIHLQATPASEEFPFDDAEQAIEQRLRGLDDYPPTGDPELSRLGEPVLQVRAFPDPAFAAETPRQSCFSGAIFKNQA